MTWLEVYQFLIENKIPRPYAILLSDCITTPIYLTPIKQLIEKYGVTEEPVPVGTVVKAPSLNQVLQEIQSRKGRK